MFVCCAVSSLTSTVGENLSASAASPRSFPASFTPKFNPHKLQKNNTSSVNKICYYSIVFPFIIWFYGSAIVIIRGWRCGFGDSKDIVTWSDNRASFTVLGFMAVVAYCRGI
jgi:hypothetical protein